MLKMLCLRHRRHPRNSKLRFELHSSREIFAPRTEIQRQREAHYDQEDTFHARAVDFQLSLSTSSRITPCRTPGQSPKKRTFVEHEHVGKCRNEALRIIELDHKEDRGWGDFLQSGQSTLTVVGFCSPRQIVHWASGRETTPLPYHFPHNGAVERRGRFSGIMLTFRSPWNWYAIRIHF